MLCLSVSLFYIHAHKQNNTHTHRHCRVVDLLPYIKTNYTFIVSSLFWKQESVFWYRGAEGQSRQIWGQWKNNLYLRYPVRKGTDFYSDKLKQRILYMKDLVLVSEPFSVAKSQQWVCSELIFSWKFCAVTNWRSREE